MLLWATAKQSRLPTEVAEILRSSDAEPYFSVVNVWEIAIKSGLGRSDFTVDPGAIRLKWIDNGYTELAVTGAHAAVIGNLPLIHRDPFDRMLVTQATVEGLELLTSDPFVARYPGPIRYFQ